jgi:hypothetical protein
MSTKQVKRNSLHFQQVNENFSLSVDSPTSPTSQLGSNYEKEKK